MTANAPSKTVKKHFYRTSLFPWLLFVGIACSVIPASGQPVAAVKSKHQGSKTFVDTTLHQPLSEMEQRQRDHYKSFFAGKGLPEELLPFFPLYVINTDFLDRLPMRVYIGKETLEKKNDYMLITIPSAQKAGIPAGEKNRYDDTEGSGKGTYHVIRYQNTASANIARYERVRPAQREKLGGYIDNFRKFMRSLGLERNFPFAFILLERETTNGDARVKIRPIMPKDNPDEDRKSESDTLSLDIPYARFCCQSPPEQSSLQKNTSDK